MTLQDAKNNIGRKVIYTPFVECYNKLKEYGVITSANDTYVFVRYSDDVNSKATIACDLELDI